MRDASEIGPVDIAVILFESGEIGDGVAPAIVDLHESGTVRVIDMAFVRRDEDGGVAFVEVEDAEIAAAFDRIDAADEIDLLSEEEILEIATNLKPGSTALVIVWENTWAGRLASAIRESDGQVVALERIPREDVLNVIAALQESGV